MISAESKGIVAGWSYRDGQYLIRWFFAIGINHGSWDVSEEKTGAYGPCCKEVFRRLRRRSTIEVNRGRFA